MAINRRRRRIRNKIIEGSAWVRVWLEKHGSNQKHQHREATCPKQQHQDRLCKSIRRQRQWQRRKKEHRLRNHQHCGKQPQRPSTDIPGSGQHIPPPDPTGKTSDYCIREGHLWKRVHVVPRTFDYSQMDQKLTAYFHQEWRSSNLWMAVGHDASTMNGQQNPQHSQQWTGPMSFEKKPP